MPTVGFERSIPVSSPPQDVWQAVTDANRVAGWISLVGDVTELEPLSKYTATLSDRLGPFRLSADLEVDVTGIDPPNSITFVADGEDRQVNSRIKVDATLTLRPSPRGCDVVVSGTYEVTGRVATLGASMIRSKADNILNEFFDALESDVG